MIPISSRYCRGRHWLARLWDGCSAPPCCPSKSRCRCAASGRGSKTAGNEAGLFPPLGCRRSLGNERRHPACREALLQRQRQHPLRRRPHHHAAVPRRQRRRVRSFDRQPQPAVRGTHQGDVADGQVAAGDELAALQRLVQNLRAGVAALDRQVDGGVVALGFGVRIRPRKAGTMAPCHSVVCQSIQRSASARRQTSSGQRVPAP